ncbi:hypothetical protein ACNVED_01365 [Legionella sp. D16C41]|uniref:hypothetical protein n=1 Tax=Legionella sp. D16C41 TaxID=3402688 RepID=UPI003AF72214
MNTRLVWNFELNLDKPIKFEELASEEQESTRWEARYFWPENEIITFYNLSSSVLAFRQVQIKERSDSYYLLPEKNLNIKKRREELLYKPLLKQKGHCSGFGKKINLMALDCAQALPGCPSLEVKVLLNLLKKSGTAVKVNKTAFIYKFNSTPSIKLELSRLIINNLVYFSASIEGRSYTLVSQISRLLLKKQVSCDYVSFLKQLKL